MSLTTSGDCDSQRYGARNTVLQWPFRTVNITTIGRGKHRRWTSPPPGAGGHGVTKLGRDGGVASDADFVLVAVPSGSVSEALDTVSRLEGKIAIDATNPSQRAVGTRVDTTP